MSKFLSLTLVLLTAMGMLALFILVLPAQGIIPTAPKAGIVVNTLEDEDNSDGDCALREAIRAASDNLAVDACPAGDEADTDTITFSTSGTITLTEQLSVTAGGPLLIDGAGAITISGGGSVRLFYVETAELTLDSLALVNGYVGQQETGGAIYNINSKLVILDSSLTGNLAGSGGAIHNVCCTLTIINSTVSGNSTINSGAGIYNGCCSLTLLNSSVSNNVAGGGGGGITNHTWMTVTNSTLNDNDSSFGGGGILITSGKVNIDDSSLSGNNASQGGGIYNDGVLTITNSTLSGNSVLSYGGGIHNGVHRELYLSGSTLSSNSAGDSGGGIENSGTISFSNSTLSENNAVINGGGIYNWDYGNVTLAHSTLSGNSAGDSGGGIYNYYGTLTLSNSTLSANSAANGSGIYNIDDSLTVYGSIVANNSGGSNCAGDAIIDGGYNLDSGDACAFDPAKGSLNNTDPQLTPLEDHGGPTHTHALLEGSPAIDAGDALSCPSADQRHAPRPFDGDEDGEAICDIGAYEWVDLITLYPPSQIGSDAPGMSVEYDILLNNFTQLTDTYTLDLGAHTWETTLSTEIIGPLPGDDSQSITVSVDIPDTATWYMTDTVIVTATSTTSPTQYFAVAPLTTLVYLPPRVSFSSFVITSTQSPDEIITVPWTISNGYGVPLTFTLKTREDVPWLSLEPTSGVVDTNDSIQVLLTFDSTSMITGEYYVFLDFKSNLPKPPSEYIYVEMDVLDRQLYLPLVVFPPDGIYGYVTENDVPVGGIPLELRFYDGQEWSTIATSTTDSAGRYLFSDVPYLGYGEEYYVLYQNVDNPNRLWIWGTRELFSYKWGDSVNIGNFDIANVELLSPRNEDIVSLPNTFRWRPRPYSTTDSYEFNLFDPYDENPYFWTDPPLGYVDSYTLYTLPSGFSEGWWYIWNVWVYSLDGGFGISYDAHWVAFISEELNSSLSLQTAESKIVRDWEYVRKR